MCWLECVPNISEGRRSGVLRQLRRAIRSIPQVHLLDMSADVDHNRSVWTLVGPEEALSEALLALYEVAVAQIDLREHGGVHPRVGAVDVVPFIPLDASRLRAIPQHPEAKISSLEDAVQAAERLAEEVSRRFDLPVFLYEEAARQPWRRNLADVRRGGLENLAERCRDPRWTPDFGPCGVHPTAGATAIGARFFLIAFNAVLDTPDVTIARKIARAVRESSGGLPAVKAIGVHLESRGLAQVSMNLVDYRKTSIFEALSEVRLHAAALGTSVRDTEIVGLVPAPALLHSLQQALKLQDLDASKVLEASFLESLLSRST